MLGKGELFILSIIVMLAATATGLIFVLIFCFALLAFLDPKQPRGSQKHAGIKPIYYNAKESFMKKCYIDSRGYLRFRDTDKSVHRWAAEKKLGRKLHTYEIVHHKDGNKTNNHPLNLIVCTQEEHERIHRENLYRYNSWYEPSFKY